mmetsp:Transcript_104097/g.335633  ORF Transcript_104097/g.335633 Transcript_104097/m.335633 type:complete len:247 (-) Transcript_104097:372-1112(-)
MLLFSASSRRLARTVASATSWLSGPAPSGRRWLANATMRCAALRWPSSSWPASGMMRQKRWGVGMKSRVSRRPSRSTTRPWRASSSTARRANFTTANCVFLATRGTLWEISGSLSTVSLMSDTKASMPRPRTQTSTWAPELSICSMPAQASRFTRLRQASSKPALPSCLQWVTASSVRARKQSPLDHTEAADSLCMMSFMVVPLPVPLEPTSTTTLPWVAPPCVGSWPTMCDARSWASMVKTLISL